MRTRRTNADHQEAVARRLALLSEQLAASREPIRVPEPEMVPAVGSEWWVGHTRPAPPRAALRTPLTVVPDSPPLMPRPLPVPGRHAARRPGSVLTDVLPSTLKGSVRVGPTQLSIVAVLVAIALAVTCWWVVRSDPEAPVLSAGSGTVPAADLVALPESVPPPETAIPAQAKVTVDVAGKVRRPGIVVLDGGARVVDALERVGGARPGVDLTTINLARVLVDGEQILVGLSGTSGAPGLAVPPVVGNEVPLALVDLNLATQAELETLPDVGPVTAVSIIAWRDEHGGFSAVTELLEVDGIGDATLAQLTPLVTV